MSGKLKEIISSLTDDEASEIEIHRLLRGLQSEQGLEKSFFFYQRIGRTIRNPSSSARHPGVDRFSVDEHSALFQRISAAIAEEETHDVKIKPQRNWINSSSVLAAAASIVVAVGIVITISMQTPESANNGIVSANNGIVSANDNAITQTVANTDVPEPELQELDEEKQKQVREYLNQHDRMSRFNPNSTLVVNPVQK